MRWYRQAAAAATQHVFEAAALPPEDELIDVRVPLLILRDKTERPEGVMAGVSRLIGTAPGRIVAEVRRLMENPAERAKMSRQCAPFGDGRAAERIAAIISRWLVERRLTRRTG